MLAGFRYRNNTVVKTGLLILKFLVLNLVKVYLWALRSPFFMPFTTHSNPLPLLFRNLIPLSQQLRQESGKFLGINPKSPYLCISYLIHTLVVFSYIYFGYWLVIKYKGFTVMRAPLLILFLFIQKSNIFKTRKKEV